MLARATAFFQERRGNVDQEVADFLTLREIPGLTPESLQQQPRILRQMWFDLIMAMGGPRR
jgi:hypothetical protein